MAERKTKNTGSMPRQTRRRDKERRAKDRWRKEHMQNTTPEERRDKQAAKKL